MPLALGDRLGHFEIVAPIGAGGMGEVYRAHDPRLGRDVAIKVLPAEVANDPVRLQRFEHEARAAAALNHSNILALYDIGRDHDVAYMVTELLEGRTLREALEAETLAISRVLDMAAQIADGLAAAHGRTIAHRDIKPENLFVTADGRVKILDFGLAKTIDSGDAVGLPTRSATAPHTVLGTAGYMAPEQVRGQPVDHRADIFAFGAVLYEMVTGRRAFSGETTLDTMSAILREAPATMASTRERLLPPSLLRIVDRCLEKSPAARFQSTTDLAFALRNLSTSEPGAPVGDVASGPSGRPTWRRALPWALASVLALAAVSAWWIRPAAIPASAPEVVTFAVPEPPGAQFSGAPVAPFPALSPDGRHLVFAAGIPGKGQQLWLRSLSGVDARPLAGTGMSMAAGVRLAPMSFWSPDSRSIAFFSEGKLKRIDLESGVVQTICDVAGHDGGTWGPDGTIVFAGADRVLQRVPARGGVPVTLPMTDERIGKIHRLPSFLPDGRHFLFRTADRTTWVGSLDGNAPRQVLPETDSAATYVPPGFLLFVRQDALMAQRFDAGRLTVEGDPMFVAEPVPATGLGRAPFSASTTGVLAYRAGTIPTDVVPLTWLDRGGQILGAVPNASARHSRLQMFPDGRRVMTHIHDAEAGGGDLWTIDLETGARARVTDDPGHDHAPVLSPDGQEVMWSSTRAGGNRIFRKPSGGSGAETLWLGNPERGAPSDWSRNWILIDVLTDQQDLDLWYAPAGDPARARPYLQTRYNESRGRLSPDEAWIVYLSNEGTSAQLFLSSFPDPAGGKWAVSGPVRAGSPRWSTDGKEILFAGMSPGNPGRLNIFATAVETNVRPPRVHPPRLLSEVSLLQLGNEHGGLVDVIQTKDGQRFLVNAAPAREDEPGTVTVVVNWPSLLVKH